MALITFRPVKDMLDLGASPLPVPMALITLAVGSVLFSNSYAAYLAGMKRYESAGC